MANPALPFFLYVDAAPEGMAAILCQEDQGIHFPIHLLSRDLTEAEKKLSRPEALLLSTSWAMRKLRVYTEFSHTTILVPEKEAIKVYSDQEVHSRVKARLLDLSVY